MGMFLKVMIPVISRRTAQAIIKYLFFSENPIIFLRNLFISRLFRMVYNWARVDRPCVHMSVFTGKLYTDQAFTGQAFTG
jgi:hypothetical protein